MLFCRRSFMSSPMKTEIKHKSRGGVELVWRHECLNRTAYVNYPSRKNITLHLLNEVPLMWWKAHRFYLFSVTAEFSTTPSAHPQSKHLTCGDFSFFIRLYSSTATKTIVSERLIRLAQTVLISPFKGHQYRFVLSCTLLSS